MYKPLLTSKLMLNQLSYVKSTDNTVLKHYKNFIYRFRLIFDDTYF